MLKFITPFFVACVCSCNYRVYVNGHYSHNMPFTSDRKSTYNSCFVFWTDEKIPDSAIFINETKILSPWNGLTKPDIDFKYQMINRAKKEAKRIGANVIKVTNMTDGRKTYIRDTFITKMYVLKKPSIIAYTKEMDALNIANKKANENICIVHLKNYHPANDFPIYFNDSLCGYCRHSWIMLAGVCDNFIRVDNYRLDIKFSKPGTLSYAINGSNEVKKGIGLEQGKEYYIAIWPGKYGFSLVQFDKDEF